MIKTTKRTALALFAAAGIFTGTLQAQLKVPAPSPNQTIKQAYGLSDITIDYSRPSAKGRVVFGDVVPFGKVWRTGANAATKITFGDDVKVEGSDLKAGTYAIYTVPNKDSWDIMFYKDLTLGGNVAQYKPENEVLRIKVKPATLTAKVETFTFNIADVTSTTANIEIIWEKTKVAFGVKTEIDSKVMKNIETNVINDNKPYFQAASYYYENDKDQKQALEWVNKAIEQNKAFYIVTLKAKILLKMKDAKGATDTANEAIALSKEAQNDDFVRTNEKIIADAKKIK